MDPTNPYGEANPFDGASGPAGQTQEEVVLEVDAPPAIPAGTYEATLQKLRRINYNDKVTGEPNSLIAWVFNVPWEDEILEVEGVTSVATGPPSKAYGWMVHLLGPEAVQPHARISSSELSGHQCLATIGPDPKSGWPRVVTITAALKRS